jgi:hypothetical protein
MTSTLRRNKHRAMPRAGAFARPAVRTEQPVSHPGKLVLAFCFHDARDTR